MPDRGDALSFRREIAALEPGIALAMKRANPRIFCLPKYPRRRHSEARRVLARRAETKGSRGTRSI